MSMETASNRSQQPRRLWRDSDFLKLWTSETIMLFGLQVTNLAIQLTAEETLAADSGQMGILRAAGLVPFVLTTLFAGVWIDRRRRRPILIEACLARAALLSLVPLLALVGTLCIEYLYIVSFAVGIFTVMFDLAYFSFVPSLVEREQLVDANSKLQTGASAADIGGQSLSGFLIELFTAPFALIVGTFSFLVSGLGMIFIRRSEPLPASKGHKHGQKQEIAEGLRIVFGNSYLRAVACEAATYNMFEQALLTAFLLYATRQLLMEPSLYALVITAGSVGALFGAMLAGPMHRHLGFGVALVTSMIIACGAPMLILFAEDAAGFAVPLLACSLFINGIGLGVSNVQAISLRQAITPNRLQGRMNASYRFLVTGSAPIGALVGGFLGEAIGLWPTMMVAAIGLLCALPWILFSPVIKLDQLPSNVIETAAAGEV